MDNNFGAEIWKVITGLVKHAAATLPGASGKEKKEQVVDWAAKLVNAGEALLPVARWANIPAVDAFERFLIGLAVEWAWTQLQLPEAEQHPTIAASPEVVPVA